MMSAARGWELWSTECRLVVTERSTLPAAAELVDDLLAEVEQACTRFRPDSELLGLRPDADGYAELSPMLTDLVATALTVAEDTGGAVDPTIGGTLVDLGYDRDIRLLGTTGSTAVTVVRRPTGWRTLRLDGRRLRLPAGTQLDLGATAKARRRGPGRAPGRGRARHRSAGQPGR